jgi:hypothetical protein
MERKKRNREIREKGNERGRRTQGKMKVGIGVGEIS